MPEDHRIRVLFVDDDANVLNLLQATIGALRKEWDGAVAASGDQALQLMAATPFEVVVSDMRMPGMSGCELLNRIMRDYPGTARIIMSGFADEETVIASAGAAHQYLPKPFELRTLRNNLARIRALNRRMSSAPVRELAARITTVPSIPRVYFEMLDAMQSPDCPLERISEIIAQDPGMTAKLLQLVNSAFFGFARECSRASEAIQMIGVTRVRALALGLQVFSAFNGGRLKDFNLEEVWQHSLRTGLIARLIVEEENGHHELMEQAFSAGVMHDIGKLALAAYLTDPYREICQRALAGRRPLFELEREVLGANHAELGGYLLGLWGLPAPLVEAVVFHHEPSASDESTFSVTTAVHAANVLAHQHAGSEAELPSNPVDESYLQRLGLDDRFEQWRALANAALA